VLIPVHGESDDIEMTAVESMLCIQEVEDGTDSENVMTNTIQGHQSEVIIEKGAAIVPDQIRDEERVILSNEPLSMESISTWRS
jgi:hypothetical protein